MTQPSRVRILRLAAAFVGVCAATSGGAPRVEFNRDVRPILSDTCFKCHGPDKEAREAELRLDVRGEAVRPLGEDGRVPIVPGDRAASEAWRRIIAADPDERMPPDYSHLVLTAEQKETIGRWIDQGAEYQGHWSFAPVKEPPLPGVKKQGWVRNGIDAFVLARLEGEGLTPSAEADRRSLIRRATLDLTGLPPTVGEVEAFVADPSPDAYERVVDRLLASPRYGERMAQDWLDAARYADTHGFNNDSIRFMWRWRDWVIDAFNDNKRYDAFVTEQLAGDLIPNATLDQRIASAFNRNHVMNSEVGIIDEEYRVEYAVDRASTAGTVFLGLTVQCARCHDHKFDPVSQKEFYQFLAYFNSLDEKGQSPARVDPEPLLKAPTKEQQAKLAALAAELAPLETARQERVAAAERTRGEWEPRMRAGSLALAATRPAAGGDGLLVHLALDETGGTEVADAVRCDSPGVVAGTLRPTAGKAGGGVEFDGSTTIDLGKDVAAFDRTDAYSISAWVRASASKEAGAIVARMDAGAGHRGFDLLIREGKLEAHLVSSWPRNGLRVESKGAVSIGEWHHVVATYDGSGRAAGLKLYADGRPLEAVITNDTLKGTTRANVPLLVGRRSQGTPFTGALDDVRLYGRALAEGEVRATFDRDLIGEILAGEPTKWTPAQRDAVCDHYLRSFDEAYRAVAAKIADVRRREAEVNAGVPTVMVMREMDPPRKTFVLKRGAYDAPGDEVSPGVPAVLPPMPKGAPANRLGLAMWLTDPVHPLTSRVAVNRFWYQYFGVGLVKTMEDWGVQGEAPSHPELLDWLAARFVSGGWDVKGLQRLIVTSATYRQAPRYAPELLDRDPENRLLARGPRMRLSAEAIRDNALALGGLLVDRLGGPSVMPYQPPGLWEDVVVGADYPGTKYVQGHGEDLYRRGMYTFWKRTAPPPALNTFDAPEREFCQVRRPQTNTPLQALVLLNDPTYVEASRKLGERMMREGGTGVDERLAYAFRLATARPPAAGELKTLRETFDRRLAEYRSKPEAAAKLLSVGESGRDAALDAPELAAYTTLASVLLNLDEVITK
jgi:hypothetical protein